MKHRKNIGLSMALCACVSALGVGLAFAEDAPVMANDVLLITMDKCVVKSAVTVDGKNIAGLEGAYLVSAPSDEDHSHDDAIDDGHTHVAMGQECADLDPLAPPPNPGHCCWRRTPVGWRCSHRFCPRH